MNVQKVPGRDMGDIFLYTLSTCGWCRKTKTWLSDQGVAYSYVDVDLASRSEKDAIMEKVRRWNPSCSFPTIVVNERECVVGFNPERLKEILSP